MFTKSGEVMDVAYQPEGQYFEPTIDVDRAAELLHLHPKTVQGMCRAGKLPCVRIGRRWWFRESELDAWLREQLSCQQSRRGEEL